MFVSQIKLKNQNICTPIAATKVKINDTITMSVATIRVEANIFWSWLNGPIKKQVLNKKYYKIDKTM